MPPLLTIGYEHATASAVLDELAQAAVALVVDVRAVFFKFICGVG